MIATNYRFVEQSFGLTVVMAFGLALWILAWTTHRNSSLRYALAWAFAAHCSWCVVHWQDRPGFLSYLSLSLTACAGIAVLGARRPHEGAWNFVVLGLLAVFLLPWAENALLGTDSMGPTRWIFLGALLVIGVANYLPTRQWPIAFVVGALSGMRLTELILDRPIFDISFNLLLPAAWMFDLRRRETAMPDQAWRSIRDSFGYFWSQRVREQFNASARNAGWKTTLTWQGFRPPPENSDEVLAMFRAVTKRFND